MASVDKSDCVGGIIEEAVGHMMTTLDMIDTTDKEFTKLHEVLETVCSRLMGSRHLHFAVTKILENYATDGRQLSRKIADLMLAVAKAEGRITEKPTEEKPCPDCGETKPVSEFRRYPSGTLYSRCKICDNKLKREYQRERSEWRQRN